MTERLISLGRKNLLPEEALEAFALMESRPARWSKPARFRS